jgi:hypothetical protein
MLDAHANKVVTNKNNFHSSVPGNGVGCPFVSFCKKLSNVDDENSKMQFPFVLGIEQSYKTVSSRNKLERLSIFNALNLV